jgi:hypothetical protein
MARALSPTALAAINAPECEEVFLWLMKIRNDEIVDINVVNNTEDITSNGEVYTAFGFGIILSEDDGERLPEVRLTIDNVDRMLIDEIRGVSTPLIVDLSLVLASNPDNVEMEFPKMTLRRVSYNETLITGTLVVAEILASRFPADKMSPLDYPGLY